MGEMADFTLDSDDPDWEGFQGQDKLRTCAHCGTRRLHWATTARGWRLFTEHGTIHSCSSYKKPEAPMPKTDSPSSPLPEPSMVAAMVAVMRKHGLVTPPIGGDDAHWEAAIEIANTLRAQPPESTHPVLLDLLRQALTAAERIWEDPEVLPDDDLTFSEILEREFLRALKAGTRPAMRQMVVVDGHASIVEKP